MLTDAQVAATLSQGQSLRLKDSPHLFLEVTPAGTKSWRFRVKRNGNAEFVTLGRFPTVSCAKARYLAEQALFEIESGGSPARDARMERTRETVRFADLIERWFAQHPARWSADSLRVTRTRFSCHILPHFGNRRIDDIQPADIRSLFEPMAASGKVDTIRRLRAQLVEIFEYAIELALITDNPATRVKPPKPLPPQHRAAQVTPEGLASVLRVIRSFPGSATLRAMMELQALLFVRPGELRCAEWREFDLNPVMPTWVIPAHRMKMRQPHLVPLSRQAHAILVSLHESTGSGTLVFPGHRSAKRPLSNNTMVVALRTMGVPAGEHTPHGFRATARTLLDEELGFRTDIIEHQLAHAVRDPNGRAYNRTNFHAERRLMMQTWSDYLDQLAGGDPDAWLAEHVMPLRQRVFRGA